MSNKPIKDQLLELGLLKLAEGKPRLHKAYRVKKCKEEDRDCPKCTLYQYGQCLEKYGK